MIESVFQGEGGPLEFPLHWLILLVFLFIVVALPAFLLYRHGKNVGDKEGYIRGFKEGHQANAEQK